MAPNRPTALRNMKLIAHNQEQPCDNGLKVLKLNNDVDPTTVDLSGVDRVELVFPQFTDGRAFSQAFLLRRRLRFGGTIRATGDVLVDQLQQMQRCGFSEAVLAHLIRLYGQTMQGFMGPWLEQQLKWMAEWQASGAVPSFVPGWPQSQAGAFAAPALDAVQEQMKKSAEQMLGVFGLKT